MPLKIFRRLIAPATGAVFLLATPALAQLPTLPPPTVAPVLAKLDPLLQNVVSLTSGRSLVIVRAIDADAIEAVRQLIANSGGTPGRALPLIEAVAADVPNDSLAVLTNSPLIRRIALDRLMLGSLDRTAAATGATAVRQTFGYDGSGIGVAVIDSGVAPGHDDLSDASTPGAHRVDAFVDFVDSRADPYDDYGHGTHVAGVVAGNGYDSGGGRTGIAPAARLTVLKVLDGFGRGRISNVIAALGYIADHRARLNIRVANLSIGAGVYESYETDLLTLAAKRLVEAGVVVVASAGNGGRTRAGDRQYGAITAPGNAPWVLTVGASSHMGSIARADDTVADFSSRGPTAIDRAAKPDVVAPGVGTVSLSSQDSHLYRTLWQARLAGTIDPGYFPYLSLSGTSQAAPVVTGIVALLLQANPSLTPNAVKAILQYTAESHPSYDVLTQGAGFVNARAAIDLALHFATPGSTYAPASDVSAHLIWGTRRVSAGRLTPDANAWGLNVVWGTTTAPDGAPIQWGVTGSTSAGDGSSSTTTGCADAPECTTVQWRIDTTIYAENVVWGTYCGGDDCQDRQWSVNDQTVVWGTGDTEGDTVVWGTGDTEGDTVVWGTSDNATVIWPPPGTDESGGECEYVDSQAVH